jgi:hypothetical protein
MYHYLWKDWHDDKNKKELYKIKFQCNENNKHLWVLTQTLKTLEAVAVDVLHLHFRTAASNINNNNINNNNSNNNKVIGILQWLTPLINNAYND